MNKRLAIKIFLILTTVILIIGLFSLAPKYFPPKQAIISSSPVVNNDPKPIKTQPRLAWPINSALERVTKKSFGIYVTPQSSPVSPEKFTGYHTGVDFEITPDEENKDRTTRLIL